MKQAYGHLILALGIALSIGGSNGRARSTAFVQGKEIVGATLTSFTEKGHSLTLKIKNVQLDSQDADKEIYLYTVLYQRPDNQWHNLCLPSTEGTTQAIPLSGRWDEAGNYINDGSITFACTDGALGKCVRWGYKPWKTFKGESLRDYHQACTRMVRADYCGNGVGHTQDGTPIDVYDRLGLQQRTKESGMVFEAAWDINGVVTLNRPRFKEAMMQLVKDCPKKLKSAIEQGKSEDRLLAGTSQPLLFNDSFANPVGRL